MESSENLLQVAVAQFLAQLDDAVLITVQAMQAMQMAIP